MQKCLCFLVLLNFSCNFLVLLNSFWSPPPSQKKQKRQNASPDLHAYLAHGFCLRIPCVPVLAYTWVPDWGSPGRVLGFQKEMAQFSIGNSTFLRIWHYLVPFRSPILRGWFSASFVIRGTSRTQNLCTRRDKSISWHKQWFCGDADRRWRFRSFFSRTSLESQNSRRTNSTKTDTEKVPNSVSSSKRYYYLYKTVPLFFGIRELRARIHVEPQSGDSRNTAQTILQPRRSNITQAQISSLSHFYNIDPDGLHLLFVVVMDSGISYGQWDQFRTSTILFMANTLPYNLAAVRWSVRNPIARPTNFLIPDSVLWRSCHNHPHFANYTTDIPRCCIAIGTILWNLDPQPKRWTRES